MNTWVSVIVVAVGLLLLVAGLVRYRRKQQGKDNADEPLKVGNTGDGENQRDEDAGQRRSALGILTSFRAKAFYFFVIVFAVAIGVLYLSYQLAGLVATIVYAFLFFFTLALLPVTIGVFGSSTPGKKSLGKGHIILGAFAFGHHYLVQRDDRWEWCPGTENQIWIDKEWHQIKNGFENKNVLGWRPFGIARFKDDDGAFLRERVDEEARRLRYPDKSLNAAMSDGGKTEIVNEDSENKSVENPIEMGGYEVKNRPKAAGYDGRWVLDIRRIMTEGVKKIGDIELVETAEDIIERGQVDDGRLGSHKPMITFIVSLLFGVITGFIYLYVGA